MRSLLLIVSLALSIQAHAQDLFVRITHYDSTDQLTVDEKDAYYYQVDSVVGTISRRNAFYTKGGQLRFSEETGDASEERQRTYFYQTGELMAKGSYISGGPSGNFIMYYANGKPLAELKFSSREKNSVEPQEYSIINYWNSDGVKVINAGNGSGYLDFPVLKDMLYPGEGTVVNGHKHGKWKGNERGGVFEDEYRNGIEVGGVYKKDGKEYRYERVDYPAQYKDGMYAFYKFVGNTMKYPPNARRNDVQGKVFVEFIINEGGKVTNVKVVKGIPELNAEAVRAVSGAPGWNPPLHRGIPRKILMVMPITFKIG